MLQPQPHRSGGWGGVGGERCLYGCPSGPGLGRGWVARDAFAYAVRVVVMVVLWVVIVCGEGWCTAGLAFVTARETSGIWQ